ncbi:interleukin-7 receptor subunit alpha [Centroberyx affinis]|uniref:interleukin-7 receptor subunit alpha n=1 Tax=Centroberyx affinis TaxID=166261 RepID=UPI003A5BF8E6
MLFGFWIWIWTVPLLLLLLLPAGTEAQSGDMETDTEPRMTCTSHISRRGINSLTCSLVNGNRDNEDDEDHEGDDIEGMTVCPHDKKQKTIQCVEQPGHTLTSAELIPITEYDLTVQLRRGGTMTKKLDLRKIVKPRSPEVWNATFHPELNKAVIYFRSTYQEDYLNLRTLLFQLDIWSAGNPPVSQQNISGEVVTIEGEYLQKNAYYHVKVRTIPNRYFEGTWSDWSPTVIFSTHIDSEEDPEERPVLLYYLTVGLVILSLVPLSIFLWKKKILTYMWPSIPHPKHTLVQIYTPIKGLPVSFNPEAFSDLKIYPVERIEEIEAESTAADDILNLKDPCSAQASSGETSGSSRSNTSLNTEESEVSTLLCSSGGEDCPQSRSPSPSPAGVPQPRDGPDGTDASRPEHNTGKNYPEMYGVTQQGKDEAYVTMSSFYQTK